MADVHAKLEQLTALIEGAKSMPLSSSCVLPRGELLAVIEEVRQLLPSELAAASDVLSDRASVVDEGRAEAEAIIAKATAERARLVSRSEVASEARRQAQEMLDEARDSARVMRDEVEDYVDSKLANFEVVLHKTLSAVERGRAKLGGGGEEVDGADLRGDSDVLDDV
jgi:cell division septum initiation protein DivIVA